MFLLLMLLPCVLHAQAVPSDPTSALQGLSASSAGDRALLLEQRNLALLGTGPVDPDTYVLGPGDLLGLEVLGAYSLSSENVIAADGSVTFPQLGTFALSGRTLTQAREEVLGKGRHLVREAELKLLLRGTRAFKVYVTGAVVAPGAVRASAVTRVSEVLAAAEGFRDSADVRNIVIRGADGTERSADLFRFLLGGDLSGNPTLIDGDVVVVPHRTHRLRFLGAFQYPGAYGFVEGDELGEMLGWIGLLPQADRSHALIQRFQETGTWDTLSVNLQQVMDGIVQVPLQAGDNVLVRARGDWRTDMSVLVRGAVQFPGPVPIISRRTRLSEAVRLAGGLLEDGLANRVIMTRVFAADSIRVPDPVGEKAFVEAITRQPRRESVVDMTAGLDPILETGDVITVPRWGGWIEVTGQVKNPGLYDYTSGWSARDYVNAAGGLGKNADPGKARLARGNSGDIQFAGDVQEMAPGDLLWIPEKTGKSFWQTFTEVISVAASAAALVLVVDAAVSN